MTTPNVVKGVGKLDYIYIYMAGGNLKLCYTGNQFGNLKNLTCIYYTTQCPLQHLSRKMEICLYKNLYMSVHNCVTYSYQKLEAIQMSYNGWMDKLWYIHTTKYNSAIKWTNYWYTQQRGWISGNYAEWKK